MFGQEIESNIVPMRVSDECMEHYKAGMNYQYFLNWNINLLNWSNIGLRLNQKVSVTLGEYAPFSQARVIGGAKSWRFSVSKILCSHGINSLCLKNLGDAALQCKMSSDFYLIEALL